MPSNEEKASPQIDTENLFNPPPPLPRMLWKDVLRLLVAALIISGALLLLNTPSIKTHIFDISAMRDDLHGKGWKGITTFIGTASLLNAIGVPKLWICIAAGTLFGVVAGSLSAFTACLTGAMINFLLGRSLLQNLVFRHMPSRLRYWYDAFNKHGFKATLYLRLFPLTNATLTSVIGGASQIKFRDFMTATAIGYVPFVLIYTLIGNSAAKKNVWHLAVGLLLFAAVALGQWAWTVIRKRRNNNTLLSGTEDNHTLEILHGKNAGI